MDNTFVNSHGTKEKNEDEKCYVNVGVAENGIILLVKGFSLVGSLKYLVKRGF